MIKRKLNGIFLLIIAFIFLQCIPSESATKKFNGTYLNNFHLYQIGSNEFVIKLYGKNLTLSEPEFFENTAQIILANTKIKNTHAMNLLTDNIEHSVPIVSDLKIENLGDDSVSIMINANSPMSLESVKQDFDGILFRIKVLDEGINESNLTQNITLQPTTNYLMFPHDALYFTADERITVEFRDAELRDIFRMLMDRVGRNVILDNSFPGGTTTMSLKNVRIDEVLNYLMKIYDISCYRAATNTVAFGARNNLYKLSGVKESKSFRIAFAETDKAVGLLKSMTTLNDSEIIVDDRMRTIHVKTNPAKMREVEKVLPKIDVPQKQVMIRASIFEFSDAATRDVQNTLELAYDRWTFSMNLRNGENLLTYDDRTYSQGTSYFDRYITASLSALERRDKGKTIANPSVIAIDGQEASVSLKQKILYRKGLNEKGGVEYGTEDVGPELKFKPIIEDNGYINLDITINTGDYLGSDSDGNIRTTKREVKTKIRVKDGMPFVVGGLHQDSDIKVNNKIPILGNIPLLGNLFSYNSKDKNRTQAVMIVTPYIIESR
ncbi:MAG: hypothetical protein IJQ99_02890 [Synergistaceae bacterium]|nr:hypothetical protein [Synergistaceae bacterium]